MPTRSHLTRPRPRQTTIHLGDDDDVKVVYDANRITPSWLESGKERDEQNDTLSLAKALADVMISWDVTEDDGTEFPPTGENIAQLSFPAQEALMGQLLEAALPSRAEGEGSSTTSSTSSTDLRQKPSDTELHQNGLQTSQSQKPSESPSLT